MDADALLTCEEFRVSLAILTRNYSLSTVHTSLDVVEEKIAAGTKNASDSRELYLGLLYPTEDYKVYGYVTNTKVMIPTQVVIGVR